jgi:hypothetical protein
MALSLWQPHTDPTPIADYFRGNYATELLTAAVVDFNIFGILAEKPSAPTDLRNRLGLAERPAVVLFSVLRAMNLVTTDSQGQFILTPLAREHLTPGGDHDMSGYIALAAEAPGVREMAIRLRANKPAQREEDGGAAYIFREGLDSAMEREASARRLTLALAGRAMNVAPVLAQRFPLNETKLLLDVGGGSGIYSIGWLQQHPRLRAIVWDRPEVLKVAAEMAERYGVANRLECVPGDMFADPVPTGADAILLSNILHDWDVPECRALVGRCTTALGVGGQLLIHDVFLNDALDGPLAVALYSAALYSLTEGRAYSAAEYRSWLTEAGLVPGDVVPTLVHCGVLPGQKR